MEQNEVLEIEMLEEHEQQQPMARNASLCITKEDLDCLKRVNDYPEDLIQDAADALGTDSPDLARTLISQMMNLHGGNSKDNLPALNAGFALLSGFKCKDSQELMMAVQLIELHKRAISFALDEASRIYYSNRVDHLDEILKIMRVFQGLMDAFNRHRRNQAALMKDSMPDAHQTAPAAANADQEPEKERNAQMNICQAPKRSKPLIEKSVVKTNPLKGTRRTNNDQ